ncbi:hypothetical protein E3N88_05001 [Mikania micrantha]|uniref:Uncharacterized protein n=1 Tax=Mikania micrantha TaxID=192012 RepID=A0A5N6PWX5_9ASTR|nr:hypothetical protein E3N88_05001 [Mikania micrantha]
MKKTTLHNFFKRKEAQAPLDNQQQTEESKHQKTPISELQENENQQEKHGNSELNNQSQILMKWRLGLASQGVDPLWWQVVMVATVRGGRGGKEIAGGRRIARRLAEIEEKEIEKSLKKLDKKANRVLIPVQKVTEAVDSAKGGIAGGDFEEGGRGKAKAELDGEGGV